MSTTVFYRLSPAAAAARLVILPLAHDVEITVFGEDGRDLTFKGLRGDYLVLLEDEDGNWIPGDVHSSDQDLEETYIPADAP